jgi:hypothetical protein
MCDPKVEQRVHCKHIANLCFTHLYSLIVPLSISKKKHTQLNPTNNMYHMGKEFLEWHSPDWGWALPLLCKRTLFQECPRSPRPYPNLMGGLNFQTEEENSGNKRKSNRVDRLASEHVRTQRKLTSHTLFLCFWNLKIIVTLHLALPTLQKLFNSIGEGGRYGVFDVRGFIVWWWVN